MNENELIEELHAEHPIDEMVKFSDLDLQQKLMDNPFLIVKYRELYYKELAEQDKLEMLMDKLIGKRYKHYRFDDDKEWSKPEIEKYCIPSDEIIIKMKKILNRQKIRVRFFEMCYKAFEKQQWSMKSFIDTLKGGF